MFFKFLIAGFSFFRKAVRSWHKTYFLEKIWKNFSRFVNEWVYHHSLLSVSGENIDSCKYFAMTYKLYLN